MTFQATVVQEKLEKAGFDARQAYGLAAVLERDVVRELEEKLVTRDYLDARLAELKSELRTDAASLRTELKTDAASLRTELKTDAASLRTEFARLQSETKSEIAGLKADMSMHRAELIKWMVGLTFGAITVNAAIMAAMVRFLK